MAKLISPGVPITTYAGADHSYAYTGMTIKDAMHDMVGSIAYRFKVTSDQELILRTDKHEINMDEIARLIPVLKERLLILEPDEKMMEKYSVLRDAYDHYKMVERLVRDTDEDGNTVP